MARKESKLHFERQIDARDRYMTSTKLSAALTRLELAINRVIEGLTRWSLEGHQHIIMRGLSYSDLLLLHSIRMRGGSAGMMDLLTFLNRHDLSNLQYSLKKLERFGLIEKTAGVGRREVSYQPCAAAHEVMGQYASVRNACLVSLLSELDEFDGAMNKAAAVLERLVGLYEQATQTHSNEMILGIEKSKP
jgi:predicted MarR family transcription regulator